MKLRRVLLLTALFILLPFTSKIFGAGFGTEQSLFTDIKATKIGDNLTVLIFETTNASNLSKTKNDETVEASASGGPGSGALDFLPLFGIKTATGNTYDGKSTLRKDQSLRSKITVTVVGMRENGDLIVKGSRSVGVGPNTETMTLTGVVRRKDVKSDNTVESYLIGDATISYDGVGSSQSSIKPGIISRIFGWLF